MFNTVTFLFSRLKITAYCADFLRSVICLRWHIARCLPSCFHCFHVNNKAYLQIDECILSITPNTSPEQLLPCIYLASNKIAPAFEGRLLYCMREKYFLCSLGNWYWRHGTAKGSQWVHWHFNSAIEGMVFFYSLKTACVSVSFVFFSRFNISNLANFEGTCQSQWRFRTGRFTVISIITTSHLFTVAMMFLPWFINIFIFVTNYSACYFTAFFSFIYF